MTCDFITICDMSVEFDHMIKINSTNLTTFDNEISKLS